MKNFFDSNVLVAAVVEEHQHHQRSLAVFSRARPSSAACGAHSLAEVYATLTRYPGRERMSPEQALFVLDEIEGRLTVVGLQQDEYRATIRRLAREGIVGARVYEGLIAACAVKTGAEVLYTWNTQHFRRLGPEISRMVRTP